MRIILGFILVICTLFISRNWLPIRKLLGYATWPLAPSFAHCERCKMKWIFNQYHSTMYTTNSGCIVLCELCWSQLIPKERLPYYRNIFVKYRKKGYWEDRNWSDIEKAVLDGK